MKKFTIIGFFVCLLIIAALLFWHHKQHSSIAPIMDSRTYSITPDTFFANLKHQIVPKDGESDIKLLRRYFQEHHIDLDIPKASVFVNEKMERLFVSVTPDDQDKVEKLVVQIVNTK
jgi:hypothetical protein